MGFLFTGQGAQYAGMGNALYHSQPTFRAALDRCAEVLQSELDRPLIELFDPAAGTLLDQTGYTQPAMFAFQYALAMLWQSWGVRPAAVMGHSVGEFAAACTAGVFSLEDGLRLIAQRARLMQSLPAGGLMAAVLAPEPQVNRILADYQGRITVAALNGPDNTVISGDEPAVREALGRFDAQGLKSKTLVTSHAFHSHRMEPILERLQQAAAPIAVGLPQVPIIANLSGRAADEHTYADPAYWSRHARSPVRFAEGLQALAADCEILLEIGPGPVLIGMGRRCLPDIERVWLPSLRPGRDDWQTLLESLAWLYVRGVKIDWEGFDRGCDRRLVELPTYPFQRKKFRSGPMPGALQTSRASQRDGQAVHPLVGRRLLAAVSERVFQSQIAAHRPAILADHKIQGAVVMPGAAYLEMALAASAAVFGKPCCVCGMSLREPLLLDKTPRTVQTILSPEGPQTAQFRIVSLKETDDGEPAFVTHAAGRVEAPSAPGEPIDLAAQRARFTGESRDDAWRVEALRKSGLEPGPTFSWTPLHWVQEHDVMAEVREPQPGDRTEEYFAHPGLLDAAFQLLGAALPGAGTGIDAYVPVSVDRLQWFDRPQGPSRYLVSLTSLEGNSAVGDARLVDLEGRVLMKLEGVRLRRVPRDWLARLIAGPLPDWCYAMNWVPQPLAPPAERAAPAEAAAAAAGRWLIFDSRDGAGAALARRFQQEGRPATLVPCDAEPAARAAAVAAAGDAKNKLHGIVYLTGLDAGGPPDALDFAAARECGWGGVLDVVRAVAQLEAAEVPRLWLATRGAQAAGECPLPLALAQSPVWGLGRVIAAELPAMLCTRIDLDPEDRTGAVQRLAEEIAWNQREDQVAYRGGQRLVARLRRLRPGGPTAWKSPAGSPTAWRSLSAGSWTTCSCGRWSASGPVPGRSRFGSALPA